VANEDYRYTKELNGLIYRTHFTLSHTAVANLKNGSVFGPPCTLSTSYITSRYTVYFHCTFLHL